MTAAMDRNTVVGVFHDRADAEGAVTALRQAGFREDQIGVVARGNEHDVASSADEQTGSHAGSGAVAGLMAGAGIGGLVGLGIIAGVIPVLGPIIAGGTLATILANAAGGAALAGLAGGLVGAGIPEDEARYYQDEFEAGRTLVTVKADGRTDDAIRILRSHNAYDMQTSPSRESTSGSAPHANASYTKTNTGAAPLAAETHHANADYTKTTPSAGSSTASTSGGQTIELKEEELTARKTPVQTGEVRVHKEVVTEHKTLEVPVQREEVVIERRAVSGGHASTGDIREGEEIRIPVKEEQVSVEKHAVVKEEVNVGKRVVNETQKVAGDVRHEEVRIEQKGDVDVRNQGGSGQS